MHASPGVQVRRISLVLVLAVTAAAGAAACGPARDDTPPESARAAASAGASVAPYDSAMVTILDTAQARMTLSQCSRPAPGPVTGYWVPTTAQVAEADAAVLRALAAVATDSSSGGAASGDSTIGARRYHRQYAGLVRGADRILYVNGMASETVASRGDTTAWRTHAVVACDGGSMFFGAEYDPATRRVGEMHFNGPG